MEKIQAHFIGTSIASNSQDAFSLYRKSHFGEPVGEKIQYSLPEALFLTEKRKMEVSHKKKWLPFKELMKKAYSNDKRIDIKLANNSHFCNVLKSVCIKNLSV